MDSFKNYYFMYKRGDISLDQLRRYAVPIVRKINEKNYQVHMQYHNVSPKREITFDTLMRNMK